MDLGQAQRNPIPPDLLAAPLEKRHTYPRRLNLAFAKLCDGCTFVQAFLVGVLHQREGHLKGAAVVHRPIGGAELPGILDGVL